MESIRPQFIIFGLVLSVAFITFYYNIDFGGLHGHLIPDLDEIDNHPRMALCLVGSAREFELTGPSILLYLVRAYMTETGGRLDLFVNSPLDEQSHKMWIFNSVKSVAAFRVFPNSDMDNNISANIVKDPAGNSLQGMLQYFRIVEGCLPLISNHELKHGFKYKWIIRTRLDSYWSNPPPPLDSFNLTRYTVPNGSHNSGLNDRFGVGGQESNIAALSRISLIPKLSDAGYRNLNSEKAFKAQLQVSGIDTDFGNFSFCILSRRTYGGNYVPVVSMDSRAPLNGAKCRPCTPRATRDQAELILEKFGYGKNPAWVGPYTKGIDICDGINGWEKGWENIFDEAAGKLLAVSRREIAGLSISSCVKKMEVLRGKTDYWDAPSPLALCKRGLLGKSISSRAQGANFVVLMNAFHKDGVSYFAVNQSEVNGVTNAKVWNGGQIFWILELLKSAKEGAISSRNEGEAMAQALNQYVKHENHLKVDLLYISIDQLEMLHAWKNHKVKSPKICQLVVRMGFGTPDGDQKLLDGISEIGLQLERCVNHRTQPQKWCTFFSPSQC